MLKKKKLLWVLIALNALCLPFAFYHNTWNYGDKWNLSPFHSLWEFFTVWWCVWNSILLFFWFFREIKINSSPTQPTEKNGKLGLLTAVVSLTSIVGFTLNIVGKVRNAKSLQEFMTGSWIWWWVYSFAWHYLVFPLALFYFLKYSAPVNLTKKKLFYLVTPFPVVFLLVNLVRNFLADQKYFGKKPFLGNIVWWFSHLEKGSYGFFLAWVAFCIFYFWMLAYWLLRFKKWINYSPSLSSQFKIMQQKMKINKGKFFVEVLKKNQKR